MSSSLAGAHFYNCTEPMVGDERMCCSTSEDCTNNLDDDSNTWTDTADNDWVQNEFACPVGVPCGISDQTEFNDCAWLKDYCDEEGYCDYRDLGVPNGFDEATGGVPAGYIVNDYYNESCDYVQDSDGTFYVRYGSDPNCPLPPPFLEHYSQNFNDTMNVLGVNEFELYNRCRYLYCSDGYYGDLPAFVPDMENDGHLARHVCPIGFYWWPGTQTCENTQECYIPSDPTAEVCHYNYETEFGYWLADHNNTIDPDCFRDFAGDEQACCPIFTTGTNTYDYVDVEYYIET